MFKIFFSYAVILLYIDLRPGRAVKIGNAPVLITGASSRGISEYNLDHGRVEWVLFVTPTRRRWASNYYITWCTGSSISWRQDAVEKASTQQNGPSDPRLSSCSWREDAGMRNMSQRVECIVYNMDEVICDPTKKVNGSYVQRGLKSL